MIDFKLSDDGDIVVAHKKELPRMRISFHASPQDVFRLSFTQGMEYRRENDAHFCLQFETKNNDVKSPATFDSCIKEDEIRQSIIMRLRTEYGELRALPEEGSLLYQVRHKELIAEDTIALVQSIVEESMADILDGEVNVVASPEKVDGPFYCQNLMIYIFKDNKLVYQFGLL